MIEYEYQIVLSLPILAKSKIIDILYNHDHFLNFLYQK